eukprot:CAMPEP_0184361238 /NCGR_PEP_ID=MMETSP1089-20130417/129145_1 /TAXON_ID=38269 ORGANISM="Gloeochaete wittrockiana, Strain SAG46.84" /NCGR_SAMPLE_ID=MMETSP1089 /ASSEMBLY_ACC=CAM_ASM_000445 /LENGTH=88 /DNA_ID=CAMNT_0026700809 /DNA_START=9 /DNA_END=272 /DNA_ORIENTATION=+
MGVSHGMTDGNVKRQLPHQELSCKAVIGGASPSHRPQDEIQSLLLVSKPGDPHQILASSDAVGKISLHTIDPSGGAPSLSSSASPAYP